MRHFCSETFEKDIATFLEEWTRLLSQDKYEEACSLCDQNEETKDFPHYNPDTLRQIVDDYQKDSAVTDPSGMQKNTRGLDFYYYTDKTGATVDYDLPINGQWSDLTAQFSFKKLETGHYFIYFEDIHVL